MDTDLAIPAQHPRPRLARWQAHPLSRRALLRRTAAGAALTLAAGSMGAARVAAAGGMAAGAALQPRDPFAAILDALERYPLVGLAERHMLQEWHDFFTALLFHPAFPGRITDIAVEFGNAAYQDLADRFILGGQPVASADLAQIWRQIGDPAWNAPVYAEFFRNVRALNWTRAEGRRIRVLLGQPPATMDQVVAHPHDRTILNTFAIPMDDHYAAVVEREVLGKGRRALLVAGPGHLLRGMYQEGNPRKANAATQLVRRHPGALFVVDPLILPPGQQQDEVGQRVLAAASRWPRPAAAALTGTWLGALTRSADNGNVNWGADRAIDAASARYEAQADMVLWLGPGEILTASQPDPAIYHWGAYPQELRRAAVIAGAGDQVAYGIRWATAGPGWFSLFQS